MLRSMFDRLRPKTRRATRSAPRLEALEGRRLLATFMPLASAVDGSANSLRAAVIQADSNGQDNTIILQTGTYHLTIPNTPGQPDGPAQGDLDLTGAGYTITIQGQGEGSTSIDCGELDRAFEIGFGVSAIIRDLVIKNGLASDAGSIASAPSVGDGLGGGIINFGTTELDRVELALCAAQGGNGVSGNTSSPAGTAGQDALGGAIYNLGTLTLSACLVDDASALGGAGGDGSSTNDPSAAGGAGGSGYGGGIYNAGTLTVSQSLIAFNLAVGSKGGTGGTNYFGVGPFGGKGGNAFGGGLYEDMNASKATIIDSTLADNSANGGAGGAGGAGGDDGGVPSNGGQGGSGGAAEGGGIFGAGPFSLYNSTIATNQASASDGGPGGPFTILNNTQSAPGQPGYTGFAFAGGIWAQSNPGSPGLVTSVSTIIALNTSAPADLGGVPDDAQANFAEASTTLLASGNGAVGISNGIDGNLVGVDPKLGPLGDNRGNTLTFALLQGSPAIDAGSNPLGLTSDQRGYPRVVGAAADIGAYEFSATAPPGGGGGGGGGAGSGPITVTVKKVRGRREVLVYDAGTAQLRYAIYPFGKSYRGNFQVTTAVLGGVDDVVVRRPHGRKKFITEVFSGIDGSALPSSLA